MSIGDLSRINTNVQSLQAYNNLNRTNAQLGMRQLRLSTGSRINQAEDDSAGYSIAKKLESKVRGQAQALSNISDAKSMLTVAEGGMNTMMDILQTLKEKTVQAANDTMGTSERTAIGNQIKELVAEIDTISTNTKFNGKGLLDGTYAGTGANFQVGDTATEKFSVSLSTMSSTSLSIGTLAVGTAASAQASITSVDNAIQTLSNKLGTLGDKQKRLTFKQENLTTSMNNYESARSRIADADFAKEQMEIVKLQILQQTGTASLAQANSAPQSVLSLF